MISLFNFGNPSFNQPSFIKFAFIPQIPPLLTPHTFIQIWYNIDIENQDLQTVQEDVRRLGIHNRSVVAEEFRKELLQ